MSRKRVEAKGVPAHELVIWTRRFAALIDVGFSLMRALAALAEEESTPGMQDLTRLVMERIEAGATLSEALYAGPTQQEVESGRFAEELERGAFGEATLAQFGRLERIFDEDYIATVRVGEVGGVLQIALNRLVARHERGLWPLPRVQAGTVSRAELAEWFWRFGTMLEAGVPVLFALETLKRVSRPPLDRISWEMRDEVAAGGSIAPTREDTPPEEMPAMWRHTGLFEETVRLLTGGGVWFGPLDKMLLRVAELLAHEARMEREGKLSPLTTVTTPPRPPSVEELKEEHVVVRQVNDLLKTAIEKGAQWMGMEPAEEGAGQATLTKGGDTLATLTLARYEEMVRRIRIIADIDPFTQEERRSQIHLGYQHRKYFISVHSRPAAGGGRLSLHFGEDEKAVQL